MRLPFGRLFVVLFMTFVSVMLTEIDRFTNYYATMGSEFLQHDSLHIPPTPRGKRIDQDNQADDDDDDGYDDDDGEPLITKEISSSTSQRNTTNIPNVCLLMSFPNSGTTYTMLNVMTMSQRAVAASYKTPDFAKHPAFPAGLRLSKNVPKLPPVFLLTKTHCKGFLAQHKVIQTKKNFWKACRKALGKRKKSDLQITRAVHLFRDPFDNVIARMHYAKRFNHTREGFLGFCDQIDSTPRPYVLKTIKESNADTTLKTKMTQLPCLNEWYRWTHWHNRAIEVTQAQKLSVLYLHYEDYSTKYNQTVQDLLQFLQLPVVHEPLPFQTGKTYQTLFMNEEIELATRIIKNEASPALWKHIQHYFP